MSVGQAETPPFSNPKPAQFYKKSVGPIKVGWVVSIGSQFGQAQVHSPMDQQAMYIHCNEN